MDMVRRNGTGMSLWSQSFRSKQVGVLSKQLRTGFGTEASYTA